MKYSLLIICLLLFATTTSHAIDYGLPKNEFGFDGGKIQGISGNDFEELVDEVNVFGVHYTRFITPRFGIGGQIDYMKVDESEASYQYGNDPANQIYSFQSLDVQNKFEDISLMAVGRINAWTRGIVIPYVSAGLGLNRFSINTTAFAYTYFSMPDPLNPGSTISTSSSGSESEKDSSINVCGMIGLGADIMISEIFRIGIEGRYNYYKQSAIKDAGDLEMFMTKSKISWYF